jgi:putative phosphoesterase
MRIAVLSDIHGNLTAFEAVLADLRHSAPDIVLHGGDLADAGSSPVEIIDRIRDMGWPGVMGNTDEMLVRPEALEAFANASSAPPSLWDAIRQIASATRTSLGEERLAWLEGLPCTITEADLALVHASPESCWRVPAAKMTDEELESVYGSLGRRIVVFGHTHVPAVRMTAGQPALLINTGSVGLPYDGDPRASYLLLDSGVPEIRRVVYNVEKELQALSVCGCPERSGPQRCCERVFPRCLDVDRSPLPGQNIHFR